MNAARVIVIGVFVGLASGRSGAAHAQTPPKDATPQGLKLGSIVTGEVRKDSPVVPVPAVNANPQEAPVRAVSFRVALPLGATTIELVSYVFDAYLVVRDRGGRILAEDDNSLLHSSDFTHARVVMKEDRPTEVDVLACALHGNVGAFEICAKEGAPAQLSAKEWQELAFKHAQRALEARLQAFGEDDPNTARSLGDLANLWVHQGDFVKAYPLIERQLRIREKILGLEDKDTALSLNNLAYLLEHLGKQEEALEMYLRALKIREKRLPPDAENTVLNLKNLGMLLRDMARYDEARTYFDRAFESRKRSLGPNRPGTAEIESLIASVLFAQGRYDVARPFVERALEIQQKHDPGSADTSRCLVDLGILLKNEKRYDEARAAYDSALKIQERVLGPKDEEVVTTLTNIAVLLEAQGKVDEACGYYVRAINIQEKSARPDDLTAATRLAAYASALTTQEKFGEASPLFDRALTIQEKLLRPDDPEIAKTLNNYGFVLEALGRHEDAIRLLERAVTIREKLKGSARLDLAISLTSLGVPLLAQGKYEEARLRLETALEIREEISGPDSTETAASLNHLALALEKQGRFEEARESFARALAIFEKTPGPERREKSQSQNGLALLLHYEGKYEESRPFYEHALTIFENTTGKESLDTASALNNLAELYSDQGKYEEARPLYDRALSIKKLRCGSGDARLFTGFNNLGRLLYAQGKHEEAREHFERALTIAHENPDASQPDAEAGCLVNLASVCRSNRNYVKAQEFLQRSLDVQATTHRTESHATIVALANLAQVLEVQGKCEAVRPVFDRALKVSEKIHGPDHPDTATCLVALADWLNAHGKCEEARRLIERALSIREKTLGAEHPDLAFTRSSLGIALLGLGAKNDAARLASESFNAVLAYSRREAAGAPEEGIRRAVAGLARAFDGLLAMSAVDPSSRDGLFERAIVVRTEGFRLQSERRRQLTANADPAVQKKIEALQLKTAALSNLFSASDVPDQKEFERNVLRLRTEREQLEREMAAAFAALPQPRSVTADEIRSALPPKTALIVMAEHSVYEPARLKDGAVVDHGRWSEPRTTVWVTKAGDKSTAQVELGVRSVLESAVQNYLGAVNVTVRGAAAADHGSSRQDLAAALRKVVWNPLIPFVGDAETVFLIPDGPLTTLPFGLIEEESGRHLIEKHAFVIIDDVERFVRPTAASSRPVTTAAPTLLAIGGLDYEMRGAVADGRLAFAEQRGSWTSVWPGLEHTPEEVSRIIAFHKHQFPDSPRDLLTGGEATEERVKLAMSKSSVLHFATHGYFMVDGLDSLIEAIHEEGARERLDTQERRLLAGYWPEFLCGLVCSGANRPEPGAENGLLTGQEISGLDLTRCDLAVLSACDTALGRPAAGDGLLSLTRAFREAGARTVISSLWPVRDAATEELMLDFYDRLWTHHESKLDALRHAQLDLLEKNRKKFGGDTRPVTWAAFVLTGDTR